MGSSRNRAVPDKWRDELKNVLTKMNGRKNILSAVLIALVFVFVTGCGQSPQQKTLQGEIAESVKKIEEQLGSLKETEKGLIADQTRFDKVNDAVQKRTGRPDSLLNALVQEHKGLVKDFKKGNEELSEVMNTLTPLPEKLNESWRFSIQLIKEDYEKAKEKVDQVAANAEIAVEKNAEIKGKVSKYDQVQPDAATQQ